ncbi:MAG TPA: hypothetical protein P5186_27020 [Candidatus Paceibacterota bacterium]|nr:hypothetical protein [Verrucomicrobiota bacterium]HRY51707.1 hypothetical protein [Candidatus Paceibacterota bacterium]HSA00781.1 hypothetical protein [Candidatus Paceibacterota bacterium]
MKWNLIRLFCIALFATITPESFAAGFRAGVAVRIVTPDPLLPLSGGVGPSEPATSKLGELTVRALVLEDGTHRVAIVGADFLGFPAVLGDKVRAGVPTISPENILIGATHTHSGPDCYGFPDGKGGTGADSKYLESVCVRMTEAINDAVAKLQPAKLKIATGEARGRIAYNYYAEQLYDPRCHVIQALDDSGQTIATLVNYAIHPEVIGNGRGVCSPDLAGPLYERITEKGGGTALFMNSAQGGMVTADNRRPGGGEANDWAECQRIGRLLADEALRIVADAPVQIAPKIYSTARSLVLPVDSPLMRQLLKALPSVPGVSASGDTVTTQLNLLNLGNAQILTIPGEALPNIGYYLKRKMRGEHNLLFGLTNDAFGYILTQEDYDSYKRYEYITRTSLAWISTEKN